MKNKKGFTLVELLAVIAILAILVLLALPNVIKIFNQAKKNTFLDEAKTIYKETTSKYISESLKGNKVNKISSKDNSKLNLTGEDMDYCVLLNNKGEVDKIAVGNNNYHIIVSDVSGIESLKIEEVLDGKLDDTTCEQENSEVKVKCTYDGNLEQGAEYTNGQYKYIYKKEKNGTNYNSFGKLTIDGWGVYLIDSNSTEPVTSTLCSSINDMPIVSMSYMFASSLAKSIDLSSFDTSNVTNMKYIFFRTNTEKLDLSSFDTSNVTNMEAMFKTSNLSEIDLSNFNTSNVTNMSYLFSDTKVQSLDLSSFDTSNVTNMYGMFSDTKVQSLDLSSFNTAKVKYMGNMFDNSQMKILDLSSFDTSNADMYCTFCGSQATIGYARTQADAEKFNNSLAIPDKLRFQVKNN